MHIKSNKNIQIELSDLKKIVKEQLLIIKNNDEKSNIIRAELNISNSRLAQFTTDIFWQDAFTKNNKSTVESRQIKQIFNLFDIDFSRLIQIEKINNQQKINFKYKLKKITLFKKKKIKTICLAILLLLFFVWVLVFKKLSTSSVISNRFSVDQNILELKEDFLSLNPMKAAYEIGAGSKYIEVISGSEDKFYYSIKGDQKQAVVVLKGLTRLFFDGSLTLYISQSAEYKLIYKARIYEQLSFNKNRSIIKFE